MWGSLWQLINSALIIIQNTTTEQPPIVQPIVDDTLANEFSNQINAKLVGKSDCPAGLKFGNGPPAEPCIRPSDPNNLPPSPIEKWFTKEIFDDLFPKANIGWGPHPCTPYSYEAFVIAARYFPLFGNESPNSNYTELENTRRDLAAFFAHAVQETGENDANLYLILSKEEADDCFYRGGFFNWFEGGPTSSFLNAESPGYSPVDGKKCHTNGKYCVSTNEIDYWFPCVKETVKDGEMHSGCYFGRGAIQISYNYNYGQFEQWLRSKKIFVDLLNDPNQIMTKMDPPLAMLASVWFYMTPQPPKPAMHDIVMGKWNAGAKNKAKGYDGPIFGPTSLVINNECNGEDASEPGGPGESRRIKAFKWFCNYFKVPVGLEEHLSCKGMPEKLDTLRYRYSWQPDWANTWREKPCDCAPATYGGLIPFFDPDYYPDEFVALNELNRQRCVFSIYDNPSMYGMDNKTSPCLTHRVPFRLSRDGAVNISRDGAVNVSRDGAVNVGR